MDAKNDLFFRRNGKINCYASGELVFFEIEPINMIASSNENLARPVDIVFSCVSKRKVKGYLNGIFLDDIDTFTGLMNGRRKFRVKSRELIDEI